MNAEEIYRKYFLEEKKEEENKTLREYGEKFLVYDEVSDLPNTSAIGEIMTLPPGSLFICPTHQLAQFWKQNCQKTFDPTLNYIKFLSLSQFTNEWGIRGIHVSGREIVGFDPAVYDLLLKRSREEFDKFIQAAECHYMAGYKVKWDKVAIEKLYEKHYP